MNENSSIGQLKGVGEKTSQQFAKLQIYTVGDLIRYFPKRYEVYEKPVLISELEEGKVQTVEGSIYGKVQVGGNPKLQVTTGYLKDLTGTLKVIWFRMPFLRNTLKSGPIILRGRIIHKKGTLVMEHPEIFYPAHAYDEKQNTLQPVYPVTTGLTNNAVVKAMRQSLEYLDLKRDFLPEYIRENYQLAEYNFAVKGVHFPESKDVFYHARNRIVFEEFLIFILALRRIKECEEKEHNYYRLTYDNRIGRFMEALPFSLTRAQKHVWQEIYHDMSGEHMMSRLVQGDVGSGKTIVAVLAALLTGFNGYQSALMAPTEVLARQHFLNISKMAADYQLNLPVELLTGSMTAKEKKEAYARIECGISKIIIGTHALIQEKVNYKNLALVITDEQHRFGVSQREQLSMKGKKPHILVMSATPIPRTLAIILYGDLDISVIDELPANRLPIKNCVVDTGYRKTAYDFMKKQVQGGRQCYVICPMVEESEHLEAENVLDYTQMLSEELPPSIKLGCLHGRMKQQEKDFIMEQFARNEIQVLVSTTVIEVGIDVPNATVMLIENAERFGLAQLHQLRGRVGRGKHQSYCIFMSGSKAEETKERLSILNKSNDGFYIASEDLKLRGPGDLFGIRQSGILDFKMGDVFQDANVLKQAAQAATDIMNKDLKLARPEHQNLKKQLEHYMEKASILTTL